MGVTFYLSGLLTSYLQGSPGLRLQAAEQFIAVPLGTAQPLIEPFISIPVGIGTQSPPQNSFMHGVLIFSIFCDEFCFMLCPCWSLHEDIGRLGNW